jgi:hypothetical protein
VNVTAWLAAERAKEQQEVDLMTPEEHVVALTLLLQKVGGSALAWQGRAGQGCRLAVIVAVIAAAV